MGYEEGSDRIKYSSEMVIKDEQILRVEGTNISAVSDLMPIISIVSITIVDTRLSHGTVYPKLSHALSKLRRLQLESVAALICLHTN